MEKEELKFEKRLLDMADSAYTKGMPVYTDYLNLNELHIFHSVKGKVSYMDTFTFGGYEYAERQMAVFLPEALSFCGKEFQAEEDNLLKESFPMEIVKVEPLNRKFADKLTHRDYLGAVLNLGIQRGKIGDIIVQEDAAYIFCKEPMGTYLAEELYRVKHTEVSSMLAEKENFSYRPEYKEITGTVASIRLDAVLSLAFSLSRSKFASVIKGGKVFINGKLVLSVSQALKEGDVVSVRGLGKFLFKEIGSKSRKGRSYILLHKYI